MNFTAVDLGRVERKSSISDEQVERGEGEKSPPDSSKAGDNAVGRSKSAQLRASEAEVFCVAEYFYGEKTLD